MKRSCDIASLVDLLVKLVDFLESSEEEIINTYMAIRRLGSSIIFFINYFPYVIFEFYVKQARLVYFHTFV